MKAIQVDTTIRSTLMAWNMFELSWGTGGAKRAVAIHEHGWCEERSGAVASGEPFEAAEVEGRTTVSAAFACHALRDQIVLDGTRNFFVYNLTDEVEENHVEGWNEIGVLIPLLLWR